MKKIFYLSRHLLILVLGFFCSNTFAVDTAPVSGVAVVYPSKEPIANAVITILETGTKLVTDTQGKFGPIYWPVGQNITMVLEKKGFRTTQTATVTVPPEGLTDLHHNITFQVPTDLTFYMLALITGAKLDENFCHVAATITAKGKTIYDAPQGEDNSTVLLTPGTTQTPFYFGIFPDGSTDPFVKGLTQTSLDGGLVYFNLQPMDQPYTMTAVKSGVAFTVAKFICRKGIFINLSPPQGPIVI